MKAVTYCDEWVIPERINRNKDVCIGIFSCFFFLLRGQLVCLCSGDRAMGLIGQPLVAQLDQQTGVRESQRVSCTIYLKHML